MPASEARRGLLPAAVLLFALAALFVARASLPEEWVVETWDLGAAQFAAFYLALLGVGLLQESDNARRFVCFACTLLLLLGTALVVFGHGRDRLFGLALAALAGGHMGLLLGRHRSPARVAVSCVVAAVGSTIVFPLEVAMARAPREEARRKLAEWTAADTSWARDDLGVRLTAPAGWVVLRPRSPYVPSDPAVVLALLHPRSDARVVLRLEPETQARSLEDDLEGFADAWQRQAPGLRVEGRGATALGGATARRIDVAWSRERTDFAGDAVAWRDATRTLVLVTWYEATAAEQAVQALDELRRALSVTLPLTAQIARNVDAACGEMPQMTRRAIELVASRRPDADPPGLFREGLAAASLGFPRLGLQQASEMVEINRSLYQRMPAGDARWMEDYLRRLRSAEPVSSEEDARGMRAMAAAVNRLPEPARARLRILLEVAIAAALEPPRTPATAASSPDESFQGEPASEPPPSDVLEEPGPAGVEDTGT